MSEANSQALDVIPGILFDPRLSIPELLTGREWFITSPSGKEVSSERAEPP
jgi:hypothetical protein